jgi:hypothetical protein
VNVPVAPLWHCANPDEETVTLAVGALLAHTPQLAGCGVTVQGAAVKLPVAVNCTSWPDA